MKHINVIKCYHHLYSLIKFITLINRLIKIYIIIKQKQNIRTKTNRGKTFINIWII